MITVYLYLLKKISEVHTKIKYNLLSSFLLQNKFIKALYNFEYKLNPIHLKQKLNI